MDHFCVDVDKWFLSNTRKSVHDNDLYNAFVVLKIICYFHRNNVMFGVSNSSDADLRRTASMSPNYKYSPTKTQTRKAELLASPSSRHSYRAQMRSNASKTRTSSASRASSRKLKSVNDGMSAITSNTQDAETVYTNMLRVNGVPPSFYTQKRSDDIYPLSYPIFCQVFFTFVEVIGDFYSNMVKIGAPRGYSYALLCKTIYFISTSSSSNKPYKTGLLDFIGYYKTYNQLCKLGFTLEEIETLKRYNLHKVLMYNKDIETVLPMYELRLDNMLKKCVKNGIDYDNAMSQYKNFMKEYRREELPMIKYLCFFINLGNTEDVGTILLHITEGELVEPGVVRKLLSSFSVQPEMAESVLTDFHKAHELLMSQKYEDILYNSCNSGERFKYSCPNGKKYIMLCNQSRDDMDDDYNKQIITAYCDMS